MTMLWAPDGSGCGFAPWEGASELDEVVRFADVAGDWAMETIWAGGRFAWPPCPRHPDNHPLVPRVGHSGPEWYCNKTDDAIALIGQLQPEAPRRPRRRR